jgi:hypothetical protein
VPGTEDGIEDQDGSLVPASRTPHPDPVTLSLHAEKTHHRPVIEHEKPDPVEVGSPYLVPWMVRRRGPGTWGPVGLVLSHQLSPHHLAPAGQDAWFRRTAGRLADRYVRRLRQVFFAALAASRAAVLELEKPGSNG